ncbi:single-stranded DNA-binding protein [Metabacillus sp. Hm71]|uniref:single-stranded DNA-binding protein n=1 Tax=Metabacillus sp. Hm71 TaxID=3450743 RepID=UPI003F43813C
MLNRVVLVGRMVRDPELRYGQSGNAVCSFNIAVNRFGKDEADFPSIVCFKKVAENTANFCKKGSLVGIDGKLQTRTYKDKSDKTVYVTEVVADSVQFLDSKKQENNQNTNQSNNDPFGGTPVDMDDSLPF